MILRETPRFTISILFDAIGEDSNELGTNIARRRHGGGGLIAARQQAYTLLPLFGLLGEFTRRNSAVKNWPSQLALPRGILASASAEIQPTTLYEADEILALALESKKTAEVATAKSVVFPHLCFKAPPTASALQMEGRQW